MFYPKEAMYHKFQRCSFEDEKFSLTAELFEKQLHVNKYAFQKSHVMKRDLSLTNPPPLLTLLTFLKVSKTKTQL